MALGPDGDVWRNKDFREWRIGRDAEVAWITENTAAGLSITSAITPLFEAYATLEHPGTGEPGTLVETSRDWDPYVAAVIGVLSEHTAEQPWWLGFLEYGGVNVVFDDVRKVGLTDNEDLRRDASGG